MRRFFFLLCLAASLLHGPAAAQAARGLIVKLKTPSAAPAGQREQPQALRERVRTLVQDAGVATGAGAAIGGGHHALRFARPLQGAELEAAMRRLRQHPDVASVEPDVLVRPAAFTPNDPGYPSQWHMGTASGALLAGINMPNAWSISTGSASGPVVAVLDTGVVTSHLDLQGRLLPGYDFIGDVEYANDGDGRDADASDPGDWVSAADQTALPALFGLCTRQDSSWHGTFIAGQIAALSNNGRGVAGINWKTSVLPVRVSGKCGAFVSDILDAMRWAAGLAVAGVPVNPNPARVINISFGGDVACSASYQDVINEVVAAGAVVVVAAGNERGGSLKRPADCQGVLAVGAVQANGLRTDYSNVGSNIAVMAPGGTSGQQLYSTSNSGTTVALVNDDSYGLKMGTSFATPQAAGVVSLMLALNPSLTPAQVIDRMRSGSRAHVAWGFAPTCASGVQVPCNCTTSTCGSGLLDGALALQQAQRPMAAIAAVSNVKAGAVLRLDGSASFAAAAANLQTFQWSQVSGPAATITFATAVTATVALPATEGSYVFRLLVTDDAGRTDQALLTATTPGAVVAAAGSGGGGGGGATGTAWGWALGLLAAWALVRQRQRKP